jgi:hypothetical protein
VAAFFVTRSAAAYYANTGQAAPRPLSEPGTSLTLPGTDSNARGPEPSAPAEHRTDVTTDTAARGNDGAPSGAPSTMRSSGVKSGRILSAYSARQVSSTVLSQASSRAAVETV